MTDTPKKDRALRRPDCVTEIRMGNTVLVVSGFFKESSTETAADKMEKVLKAETATQQTNYPAGAGYGKAVTPEAWPLDKPGFSLIFPPLR